MKKKHPKSELGRAELHAEFRTADGTVYVRRVGDDGIIIGVHTSELPMLRPVSAAALRTALDEILEAQAADDA